MESVCRPATSLQDWSLKIHVHPFICQITVILSGSLAIHMKDFGNTDPPYTLQPMPSAMQGGGAGFTAAAPLASPGTFFQLDNSTASEPAHVLYLCSPGYVFEPGDTPDAAPRYDDAITVGKDWDRLATQNWNPPELHDASRSYAARQNALQRLRRKPHKISSEWLSEG